MWPWPKSNNSEHQPWEVTIAAPVDVVEDAARSWGKDLGWHEMGETKSWSWDLGWHQGKHHGNERLFRLYSWFNMSSWRKRDLGVVLTFHEIDGGTRATCATERPPGYLSEYSRKTAMRICEAFTHGVCSDLAARGFRVTPTEFGTPLQDRERLKKVAKWRSRIQWGCVIGGIALLACFGVLAESVKDDSSLWPVLPLAGAFLLLIFVMIGNLIRERSVRSSGNHQIVALGTILPLWLFGVVCVFLYWLGFIT